MNGWWDWLWQQEEFLGIQWHPWKIVGWLGNLVFFSRFFVQWYFTEKQKRVVVPVAFWWLSLCGSTLLFLYAAVYQKDSVFIFAYAFTWIPYIRNLIIHHRHEEHPMECRECGRPHAADARYCSHCGVLLTAFSEPERELT